ncbi:MAG TPA: hypothetical protein VEO91_14885 [Candidatus Limnocylindria bacterium]|nr:hypothetical protein [Candidatus Limnocylindria bacterium]
MERDFGGGSDYGRDIERDMGDAPPEAIRDRAPDVLAPIDDRAPVSGHSIPQRVPAAALSRAPENDFGTAAALIVPALRPVGTPGQPVSELGQGTPDPSSQAHTRPLLDEGPCGLPVVYTMAAEGFDVLVNGDHLASWGVGVAEVQDAAIANLAAWSAQAPWTDEVSGIRRLVSSDTGEGNDAARILLPEVRDHLAGELGGDGRVLIGLPERHLLLAGALREGDEEFAELFSEFVVEHSGGADEPIDRRVFELVNGQLVEFAAT